ncbi:hypothetical protein [Celerinatantimonas sp. MCCC 1A17872]|uniref:hypothetical protein n=1 Tax=Celerinatantimonas sp. MCCC 1A17872 TaxID=3177514 RepID=UPI0038CBBAC9
MLAFLGTAELFVDGVEITAVALFSIEGLFTAIAVTIIVIAVIVIIGHVTNNFEESYLFFSDGLKSHSGYFRQLHMKIFGDIWGTKIYDVEDIAISCLGLFQLEQLPDDKIIQSFGLTIHKILDRTHRAWQSMSKTALWAEIGADLATSKYYIIKSLDWIESGFTSDDKKEKSHE